MTDLGIKYFENKRNELEETYNYVLPLFKDFAKYLCPYTVRFIATEANRKLIENKTIVDSAPVIAVRNFAAGLITGATSPADNWFKLKFENKELANLHEVKVWTDNTTELIRSIINSSNFYQILYPTYKHLGVFQLACILMQSDYDDVVNFQLLPVGSYRIDRNEKGVIDTVCRDFMMSARNIVNEYGEENCPECIVNAAKKTPTKQFEIIHFVCPNPDYKEDSPLSVDRKYMSVTYTVQNNNGKFLRKSGFTRFPYAFFEGERNGEDIYPTEGCGLYALPDVKQLYAMVKDKATAVKKMYQPAYKGPASLKNKKISDDPGAFIEEDENGRGISPIYEVPPQILELRNDVKEIKENIRSHFYNDLFAMILNTAARGRTATEVNELKEEKLVLLSPLLEQIHTSLKTIIEWIFYECNEAGILPPVPDAVQGQELKVEFISTLAQAQKVKKISGMERFATFVINLSTSLQDPVLSKKINAEKMIDDYAEFANITSSQIIPSEEIAKIRKEIAQAQAQEMQEQKAMQAIGAMQQGSQILKNVGGSDSSGGDLLERMGL